VKQLVSFRGLDDSVHASIEQQIGKPAVHRLKRHLQPFPTEPVSLRAGVESDTLRTGEAYRMTLRLVLSTTTRTARAETEHVGAALKTAFGELERQLERRRTSHLLMMDSWGGMARRDSRGRLKTVLAACTPEESARFREQMSELFAPVQRIARRELAYMRERGELSSDYPTLVDMIDKTLVRAFQRVHEHPGVSIEEDARPTRRRRTGFACVSRRRYAGSHSRRRRRGEQQIFGFWQPDETLKVEDVLPGSGEEPEEATSEHEVRLLSSKLLGQLPNAWRHEVLPVKVDDVPLLEVVVRLDTDEATVRRGLEHADAFLRTVRGTGCRGNNGSIDVPSAGLPRSECSASPARKQGDIGISSGTDISTHPLPAWEAMPSRTKRSSSWPSAVFVESPQPRRSRSPKTANAVS
jgi:DNA-directed RNA polymerase specialized sigma24 family protein/ribosome-associated translation inhibitor RaiA